MRTRTNPPARLRTRTPRTRPLAISLALAFLALALVALPRSASAQLRRPSYLHRGIVTESTHMDLAIGFAYAQDWTIPAPAPNNGPAVHTEAMIGVAKVLEIGAGFGLRFTQGAANAQADQWARVNREWVPYTNRSTDVISNPYFRLRVALADRAPARLAFEIYTNFPVVRGPDAWAFGIGMPIHLGNGPVRVETGVFFEMTTHWNVNPDYWLSVPLRINFEVNRRVWLGVRSGLDWRIDTANSPFDMQHVYVPLGFQGGFRVVEPLDIVFDVVFPQFAHTSCYGGCHNVFFDVWGIGAGILLRVF